MEFLHNKVSDPAEKEALAHLLSEDFAEQLKPYLEQRHFIDLLEAFPSAHLSAQDLVDNLKKLMPRLYSIASSPCKFPQEIHLTIAVVRYQSLEKPRIGVCSTYLADRICLQEPSVPVFVSHSHFGLPEDHRVNIIMVGPGTGIAPFRAFLQERATQPNTGKSWLFFGDQHKATDFLYETEMRDYLQQGVLDDLDLAWSRDQGRKVYVQDKMREKAEKLWAWLQNGAYFYVCGDAKRMAKDVDQTLHDIAQEVGGLSEADAKAYIKDLKKEKRYQRDVY